MPYVMITIPAGTAVGKTVATTLGGKPVQVTLVGERMLKIEPDGGIGTIIGTTTENSRMTVHAICRKSGVRAPA